MISDHDQRRRRCPRLGHAVRFRYCREQAGNDLCPRILDCWWETFDVESFLCEEGEADSVAALKQGPPPPPKIATLADLVDKARKRTAGES